MQGRLQARRESSESGQAWASKVQKEHQFLAFLSCFRCSGGWRRLRSEGGARQRGRGGLLGGRVVSRGAVARRQSLPRRRRPLIAHVDVMPTHGDVGEASSPWPQV
jgi:hypothetical protein